MRRTLAITLLVLGMGRAAASFEVLTPYSQPLPEIAWASPLAGGPINAAVLHPPRAAGDPEALARRIELDLEALSFEGEEVLEDFTEIMDPERATSLPDKLPFIGQGPRPIEVVVAGAGAEMSVELAGRVAQAVREGAGLVITTYGRPLPGPLEELFSGSPPPGVEPPVVRGSGIESMPEWGRGIQPPRFAMLDEIRLVHLPYAGPPLNHGALLPPPTLPAHWERSDIDVYWNLVVRAVYWAAGRGVAPRIASVRKVEQPRPDETEAPLDVPRFAAEFGGPAPQQAPSLSSVPLVRYRLTLAEPAAEAYRVTAQLRQPGRPWRMTNDYTQTIEEGQTQYTLPLSAGAGGYLLDTWLRESGGGTAAWHTQPIQLRGGPYIQALEPARLEAAPEDVLRLLMTVDNSGRGTGGCLYLVRAFDGYGRCVSQIEGPVPQEGVPFSVSLGLSGLVSPYLRVEAFAAATPPGGDSIAPLLRHASWAQTVISVRGVLPAAHPSLVTQIPTSFEAAYDAWWPRLQEAGAVGVFLPTPVSPGRLAASLGLTPSYGLAQWTPEAILDGVVRVPSMADPAYRAGQVASLQRAAAQCWGGGSAAMLLGVGNCLAEDNENVCQSEASLERFRAWLERVYGSLSELNTSWNTDYESWDQPVPAPKDAVSAFNVFPPWLDFRLAMDHQFAGMHLLGAEAVHEVHPSALAGFVMRPGSEPGLGYDWAALADGLDLLIVPPDPFALTRLRDFCKPEGRRALWLSPSDLAPPQAAEKDPERDSPGRLSRILSSLTAGSGPEPRAFSRWQVWRGALHGIEELWFDAALAQQLVDDAPERPAAARMAASLAQELRTGVGQLLAMTAQSPKRIAMLDSQPSRYLSFAAEPVLPTPKAQQIWQALLGRYGFAWQWISPFDCTPERLAPFDAVILPGVYALGDGAVAALRAYAQPGGLLLADVEPALFDVHGAPRAEALWEALGHDGEHWRRASLGEGNALWLRPQAVEAFAGYLDAPLEALGQEWLSLTSSCGLEPLAHIEGKGGRPFVGYWTAGPLGRATVFAALAPPNETAFLDLEFPSGAELWAYDLLMGTPALNPNDIEATLEPGEAAVYSFLPYEVTGIELNPLGGAAPGRRLSFHLRIQTQDAAPGAHPVRVTLSYLGKRITPHVVNPTPRYARTLLAENGQADSFFPLALNDPQGRYLLEACDLLSGAKSTTVIVVVTQNVE